MRPIQMVDLKQQYHKIKNEVDKAVLDVLDSSVFIGGPAGKFFCKKSFSIPGSKACNSMCKWYRCTSDFYDGPWPSAR